MVKGPQVERLNKAVIGTDPIVVNNAAIEWSRCQEILETVSQYLSSASGTVKWAIGGETGPAVDAAFKRSAAAMSAKAVVLKDAVEALLDAGAAMHVAQQAAATMQDMDQPTPYTAPGDADDAQLAKEAKSKANQQAFAKAFAEQEEKARIEADDLEAAFTKSAATMKKIHGEPDPPPPPLPASEAPAGSSGGSSNGTTGHTVTPTHLTGHIGQPPHAEIGLVNDPHPTYDYVPHHPTGTDVGTPGVGTPGVGTTGSSGTPIDYVPGTGSGSSGGIGSALGVGGATAGGMAAGLLGAKLTGALKGGLFPTSGGAAAGTAGRGTASSAVRGIGSSARTGGAGTIGKSGSAAGSGAAGRSAAGTGSGAGRSGAGGAGRSGAGAGSGARAGAGGRGGAGGRTGAGPTGRSGRGKDDEKGKKHELFDVGEDWVDDEGAAPGVLD